MKTITEEQANEKFGKRWLDKCWLDKCLDGKGPVRCADHRESLDDVLKEIDKQLKPHKLQLIQVEMGGDTYYWFVEAFNA